MSKPLRALLPKSVAEWRQLLLESAAKPTNRVWFPDHFYMQNIATSTRFSPQKVSLPLTRRDKASAVLVLLAPAPTATDFQDMCILLTKRAMNLRTNKGQLSFPGGHLNAGETNAEAAQRETLEEVGLEPSSYEIVGSLSTVNHITGLPVSPQVAIAHEPICPLRVSADEVESVHYVHLSGLLQGTHSHARLVKYHSFTDGTPCYFPCFFASPTADTVCPPITPSAGARRVEEDGPYSPLLPADYPGDVVWGLTSFILCEYIARLADSLETRHPGVSCATAKSILGDSNVVARDPDRSDM